MGPFYLDWWQTFLYGWTKTLCSWFLLYQIVAGIGAHSYVHQMVSEINALPQVYQRVSGIEGHSHGKLTFVFPYVRYHMLGA